MLRTFWTFWRIGHFQKRDPKTFLKPPRPKRVRNCILGAPLGATILMNSQGILDKGILPEPWTPPLYPIPRRLLLSRSNKTNEFTLKKKLYNDYKRKMERKMCYIFMVFIQIIIPNTIKTNWEKGANPMQLVRHRVRPTLNYNTFFFSSKYVRIKAFWSVGFLYFKLVNV